MYRSGEVVSEASVLCKSAARTLETRRVYGHKIGLLISSTTTRLEFGCIEAVKTDEGVQGAKALTDARKIVKLLKDIHDCIVRKTDDPNALHELESFGLQLSRTKMTIYKLRKIRADGPHYHLVDHGSHLFPLGGLAVAAISRLLTGLVTLKKSMEAMAIKIATWAVPGIRFEHEWMGFDMRKMFSVRGGVGLASCCPERTIPEAPEPDETRQEADAYLSRETEVHEEDTGGVEEPAEE
ncbi:hypothetical protein BGZ99_006151 [Dissophora globulifera]|uniref:Uncharacterized protein n=1 Tax=Dissophora globulifera TaxID=979702 RepID=A0A9P6UZK2_9FUNG|nr:hypothetical protein BGZ99_006151 [Dissophora globulifera]